MLYLTEEPGRVGKLTGTKRKRPSLHAANRADERLLTRAPGRCPWLLCDPGNSHSRGSAAPCDSRRSACCLPNTANQTSLALLGRCHAEADDVPPPGGESMVSIRADEMLCIKCDLLSRAFAHGLFVTRGTRIVAALPLLAIPDAPLAFFRHWRRQASVPQTPPTGNLAKYNAVLGRDAPGEWGS